MHGPASTVTVQAAACKLTCAGSLEDPVPIAVNADRMRAVQVAAAQAQADRADAVRPEDRLTIARHLRCCDVFGGGCVAV